MWTPMIITDKDTGRKVHCTIFESYMYKSGFFTFNDLYEFYKDDFTVQLMNQPQKERT